MSTFFYVPQYFTTQLSVAGGIDDTQTTDIVLQDISGVDATKPGIIALTWSNPIDTSKIEYIFYTSINDSTKELVGVTRGQEGYSAKSHLNGATVAWPLSKSHINNIPDSTTTFTNKTFTLPKINEDVELTATATQLNALVGAGSVDGWTAVTDTWAYASATTITVPSGAATLYKVGDKIKLTQTTVKYFYIVGVADTVLTVTGGSDYTVENDVITSPYYSHQENPIGFPQYFNSSITFDVATLDNGSGGQPTINCARFSVSGNTCLGYMSISGTKAATTKTMVITSSGLPTPNSTLGNANSGSANYDNGSNYVPIGFIYRSSGIFWFVSATDITDNSTVANLSSQFKYQI